jgi:hypothetical protein
MGNVGAGRGGGGGTVMVVELDGGQGTAEAVMTVEVIIGAVVAVVNTAVDADGER